MRYQKWAHVHKRSPPKKAAKQETVFRVLLVLDESNTGLSFANPIWFAKRALARTQHANYKTLRGIEYERLKNLSDRPRATYANI